MPPQATPSESAPQSESVTEQVEFKVADAPVLKQEQEQTQELHPEQP